MGIGRFSDGAAAAATGLASFGSTFSVAVGAATSSVTGRMSSVCQVVKIEKTTYQLQASSWQIGWQDLAAIP